MFLKAKHLAMLFVCGIFKLNMKICVYVLVSLSQSVCFSLQDTQLPFIFHLIKQQHRFCAASPRLLLLLVLFAFISRTFQ